MDESSASWTSPDARRVAGVALGLVFLFVAVFWESSRLADPLPAYGGLVALIGGTVAAGLLGGGWWAPVVTIVVAFVVGLILVEPLDVSAARVLAYFMAGLPVFACASAIGVGVRKVTRGAARPWVALASSGALAVCVLVPAGASAYDVLRPARDVTPDDPLIVDWQRGTYAGVSLGSPVRTVVDRLGAPERRGDDEFFDAIDEGDGGFGTFHAPREPRRPSDIAFLRYQRDVFMTADGSVAGWGTRDARAQTPEGIGIGDSRELVRRRFPQARCFIENEGTEYVTYPVCQVRVCDGRLLGFSGEPISGVWVISDTKSGMRACRNPRPTTRDG
jgi:hypothetical protein